MKQEEGSTEKIWSALRQEKLYSKAGRGQKGLAEERTQETFVHEKVLPGKGRGG